MIFCAETIRSRAIYKERPMIKKAVFVTSVGDYRQIKEHYPTEIAIAGKSNVGKSSFINFICNNSKLAKTSKEPGRTKLLNYYKINDGECYFVDQIGRAHV